MVQDRYLRHMRRPSHPSEREQTESVQLDDFEALYLQRCLKEYAGYENDEEVAGIAEAYAEYIDEQVRDNGAKWVDIYAHTCTAEDILLDAVDYATIHPTEMASLIEVSLTEFWTEQ